jgi:hypothetical protein
MAHKGQTGDGDFCPQDDNHGRMFAYPISQTQVCTHSGHRGNNLYEWDGVSPRGSRQNGSGRRVRKVVHA